MKLIIAVFVISITYGCASKPKQNITCKDLRVSDKVVVQDCHIID